MHNFLHTSKIACISFSLLQHSTKSNLRHRRVCTFQFTPFASNNPQKNEFLDRHIKCLPQTALVTARRNIIAKYQYAVKVEAFILSSQINSSRCKKERPMIFSPPLQFDACLNQRIEIQGSRFFSTPSAIQILDPSSLFSLTTGTMELKGSQGPSLFNGTNAWDALRWTEGRSLMSRRGRGA